MIVKERDKKISIKETTSAHVLIVHMLQEMNSAIKKSLFF